MTVRCTAKKTKTKPAVDLLSKDTQSKDIAHENIIARVVCKGLKDTQSSICFFSLLDIWQRQGLKGGGEFPKDGKFTFLHSLDDEDIYDDNNDNDNDEYDDDDEHEMTWCDNEEDSL